MVAKISGNGHHLDGPLDSIPARYEIVSRSPASVTIRQQQYWGNAPGLRPQFVFVLEYTLRARWDSLDVKAYLWPTSATTRTATYAYRCERLAVEVLPASPYGEIEVGAPRNVVLSRILAMYASVLGPGRTP